MAILAAFMVPHPPMIVPAVGRGSEAQIRETTAAYERAAEEIAALKPETIIITSPHSIMYSDYFHISPGKGARGSFSRFGVPNVRFDEKYDTVLRDSICRLAKDRGLRAGTLGERDRELDHGTMVPLWFIRQKYKEGSIIRIGLSGLPLTDHYALGQAIRDAVEETGRRAVFIASGDLSHKLQDYGPYGYAEEGPQYDARIMDVCSRGAFGELLEFDENFCEKAAECGHRSFVIMAGAFDGTAVRARQYSHQDVTGVGYGICSFYPEGPDGSRHFLQQYLAKQKERIQEQRAQEDAFVRLARASLETYILKNQRLKLSDLQNTGAKEADIFPGNVPREMLTAQAGAFVSIHEHGKLRGCIGTILPTRKNLAEEIIHNAVSAATEDPRFAPIEAEELPWLEINVDVLGEPEEIASPRDLDAKRYGVIVSAGGRRGLLLPDLDGVDTVEQQIDIARRKGGIRPDEKVRLQRFEVVRHT